MEKERILSEAKAMLKVSESTIEGLKQTIKQLEETKEEKGKGETNSFCEKMKAINQ